MLSRKAFFSYTAITDPAVHREYNAWHQLDHRPENLALDGVRWGERFVHSPDCAAVSRKYSCPLDPTQYINMYWFREPYDDAIREWQALAEQAFQWGRRPDVVWTSRPLMGFFNVVKAYVNPRVLVSAAALPMRPVRGVYITTHRIVQPHANESEALFRWYDQTHLPAAVALAGVAGAYVFSSESCTLDPNWSPVSGSVTFDQSSSSEVGGIRIHVYYLDGDVLETAARINGLDTSPEAGLADTLFAGPLHTITPWKWDWFD